METNSKTPTSERTNWGPEIWRTKIKVMESSLRHFFLFLASYIPELELKKPKQRNEGGGRVRNTSKFAFI
jgi:hypothetical protein